MRAHVIKFLLLAFASFNAFADPFGITVNNQTNSNITAYIEGKLIKSINPNAQITINNAELPSSVCNTSDDDDCIVFMYADAYPNQNNPIGMFTIHVEDQYSAEIVNVVSEATNPQMGASQSDVSITP